MKALCMITVKPGMVDKVVQILRKKRKISKDIMVVTGRADISVILNSSIDEINSVVIDLKNVKEIVNTETLIEVEVDLAARLRKINRITESFPVSGQFDAVAVIDVEELSEIKDVTTEIQKIPGVERTETMVEVNP